MVTIVAYAGFAYALLRHRLFDIGFVINRALVFTIISTLLLLVFADWVGHKVDHTALIRRLPFPDSRH
ncbi:hypothetical protein [Rugamonas sp.]|uniref:hypothetical protein n=1 Tax=Rugamonas sp. TaxID=1926287 RepID=UPI0025EE178C|nr:hypothetical protein [Rugamonas sp.]